MWLIILIILAIVMCVIYSDVSTTNANKALREARESEKRQAESLQKEYSKKMRTHPLVVSMINDIEGYINSIIPSVQKGFPYNVYFDFFSDSVRINPVFVGEYDSANPYDKHGEINCKYSTYGFMVRDDNEHIGLSMAVVEELNFREDLHITIIREPHIRDFDNRFEVGYLGKLSNYLPEKKNLKSLV